MVKFNLFYYIGLILLQAIEIVDFWENNQAVIIKLWDIHTENKIQKYDEIYNNYLIYNNLTKIGYQYKWKNNNTEK